jgi:hypothetical protein
MKHSTLNPTATILGCAFAVAILSAVSLGSGPARADIDVRIDISNAPPAPTLLFHVRPREQFLPEERVYVVVDPDAGDYDCFRYGGYYWAFHEGYWYRSASWNTRFVVVQPRYVPTVFYQVPAERWKNHPSGPPGLMKKTGHGPPGQVKKGVQGHGKNGGSGRK